MPSQLIRRRARLARYYLKLAESHFAYTEENSLFAGINLLHEALETSLITAADAVDASVKQRDTVEVYLDKIENELSTNIPLRSEVLRFNRARISAKHALTLPSERDAREFFATIPAFCREIFVLACKIDLQEASLIDLIEDEDIKSWLLSSQNLISRDECFQSLIETRKAMYKRFLSQFDIRPFEGQKDGENYSILDDRSMCRAPIYAKSNRYISENVRTPLDYIVEDHSFIDNECLKNGVRPSDFWNVWRLTPRVVKTIGESWLIRREVRLDLEVERENAKYALDTLVDILISFQTSSQKSKYRPSGQLCLIEATAGTRIYAKCSRASELVHIVGDEGAWLSTSEANPAFDEDAHFWTVMHFSKGGHYFGGQLHQDDFDGILHPYDPAKIGLDLAK